MQDGSLVTDREHINFRVYRKTMETFDYGKNELGLRNKFSRLLIFNLDRSQDSVEDLEILVVLDEKSLVLSSFCRVFNIIKVNFNSFLQMRTSATVTCGRGGAQSLLMRGFQSFAIGWKFVKNVPHVDLKQIPILYLQDCRSRHSRC